MAWILRRTLWVKTVELCPCVTQVVGSLLWWAWMDMRVSGPFFTSRMADYYYWLVSTGVVPRLAVAPDGEAVVRVEPAWTLNRWSGSRAENSREGKHTLGGD